MLKKSERLTKKQFDRYFKTGKRLHFPYCTVVYSPLPTLHASIVVGRKVSTKAVVRNTIRRRLYAQLYRLLKQAQITGVFIVLVKPSFVSLTRKAAIEQFSFTIAEVLKKT